MNKRSFLEKLIHKFVEDAKKKKIHLYNEAGLQFELAFYLKEKLEKKNYKIQLERNIGDVTNVDSTKFIKKEMDIFIQNKETEEKYCIELKLPNKGAYPRRMSQAFKDVKFLEELNHLAKFSGGLLFFTTPLKPFWSGKHNGKGIEFFSNGNKFVGESKDGLSWNGTQYDKEGNIFGKWVNGKLIKQ